MVESEQTPLLYMYIDIIITYEAFLISLQTINIFLNWSVPLCFLC
jgi:hypothetical protein